MIMTGYVTNIERDTIENEDYRRVLFTGENTQLVLMTLRPGEEIGEETHGGHDQFIRVEAGTGYVELDGERHDLRSEEHTSELQSLMRISYAAFCLQNTK